MAECPDGFTAHGLIVWSLSRSRKTVIAKGCDMFVPSSRSISESSINARFHALAGFLIELKGGVRAQIQLTTDSNYSDVLDRFDADTERYATEDFTKFARMERSLRYREMMAQGRLRRERLRIFFTRTVDTIANNSESFLQAQEKGFRDVMEGLQRSVPDSVVRPFDDGDHIGIFRAFFNPTMFARNLGGFPVGIDESASILTNCLFSDGVTAKDSERGIFWKLDGCYQSMVVVRRWPAVAHGRTMATILESLNLNFHVSQTIEPISAEKEIRKEESILRRLENEYRRGKTIHETEIESRRDKLASLGRGLTRPYNVLTVFRIWDEDLNALNSERIALCTALANNGFVYQQVNQERQNWNLWYETFPGYYGSYRGWDLYAENSYLAGMMPVAGSFNGFIETPEALYDGDQQNLVGVRTFAGSTPQHSVMVGMTGSGKSVSIIDLIAQTECFYDFTAIIEEGLSYGLYTKMYGCEPITVVPDSDMTFNYFDTVGAPLGSEQIAMASALVLKMAGASESEDKNRLRIGMITEYINQLYWDVFEDWEKKNADIDLVAREAMAIEAYRREQMPMGSGFMETWAEFEGLKEDNPDLVKEYLGRFSDNEVNSFRVNPASRLTVRNLTFTRFKPEEFPTHSSLVEMMKFAPSDSHPAEDVKQIATMIEPWTASGSYGKLFDGASTVKLKGQKIIHIELGRISESMKELKEAVGFLMASYVRQHIVSLPRAKKKRWIFEEVARFLNIPGGDKILGEAYAQLRKFACWVVAVTQQYAQLRDTPLRPVIFGNSKSFLLLKQNDKQDVEEISEAIALPETGAYTLGSYVLPEHQRGGSYNDWCYFTIDEKIFGTVRNIVSPHILKVASSNGSTFDEMTRKMRGESDPFAVIVKAVEEDEEKAEYEAASEGRDERLVTTA